MNEPMSLYLMAALYIVAGVMHFIRPKMYLSIMPRYLPAPKALVFWSGITEIALGVGLCIPSVKTLAIYGIIVMLLVFLLVHVYMLSSKKAAAGFPRWVLLLRLPLQFVLMYWAYSYV